MPHCILEYSSNVIDEPNWPKLLRTIHEALMSTGLFVLADIKSRVIKHELYFVGSGDENLAFVTLNVQILSDRSDDVKKEITRKIQPILAQAFQQTFAHMRCSITVQVSDIHQQSYNRQINYTGD